MITNLDRSICSTCAFLEGCTLTSNHQAIWSCSEYELATHSIPQKPVSKKHYHFATINQELEFIH
uniref:hypothetical protein n=1 Tax=Gelidibacter sp. TaxID=2018083 RepID=UPI00404AD123